MLYIDEDAVICDLAETYNVYDMESLPAIRVATLVCGLRNDSRIKLKLSGVNYDINTILLAMLLDRYSAVHFNQSQDSLLAPKLLGKEKETETDIISFVSVDDYKKAMQEFNSKHMEE